MINISELKLKCSQMSFCDLESLKKLTTQEYELLIQNSDIEEDRLGFEEELSQFKIAISSILSKKLFDFIGQQ